jgi:small-conductance mechanosensitive channel
LRTANFLGNVTKWAIWIFAIMAALIHLGVAPEMIQTLFMGVVVALSLAFGLAFGLGGQEMAARLLDRTREEISHKD